VASLQKQAIDWQLTSKEEIKFTITLR